MMLHLSEQFPSGEVARSFLEDRCRRDAGRQRNYDVICREYAKDSFVEQELEYLMKEPTDSMKRAKSLCRLLKAKGSVKPQVEDADGLSGLRLSRTRYRKKAGDVLLVTVAVKGGSGR